MIYELSVEHKGIKKHLGVVESKDYEEAFDDVLNNLEVVEDEEYDDNHTRRYDVIYKGEWIGALYQDRRLPNYKAFKNAIEEAVDTIVLEEA